MTRPPNDLFFLDYFSKGQQIFLQFFVVELKREERVRAEGFYVVVDAFILDFEEFRTGGVILEIIDIFDVPCQLMIEFAVVDILLPHREVIHHNVDQILSKFRHSIVLINQIPNNNRKNT